MGLILGFTTLNGLLPATTSDAEQHRPIFLVNWLKWVRCRNNMGLSPKRRISQTHVRRFFVLQENAIITYVYICTYTQTRDLWYTSMYLQRWPGRVMHLHAHGQYLRLKGVQMFGEFQFVKPEILGVSQCCPYGMAQLQFCCLPCFRETHYWWRILQFPGFLVNTPSIVGHHMVVYHSHEQWPMCTTFWTWPLFMAKC